MLSGILVAQQFGAVVKDVCLSSRYDVRPLAVSPDIGVAGAACWDVTGSRMTFHQRGGRQGVGVM